MPKTQPYPPTRRAACDSITSRGGLRIAFPTRSRTISTAAAGQLPVSASAGTAVICTTYPAIVIGQTIPRRVREPSGPQPQRVAEQLAEPGHHADHGGARPQRSEIRSQDAAGAFVGEIREEAQDADQEDEPERRLADAAARPACGAGIGGHRRIVSALVTSPAVAGRPRWGRRAGPGWRPTPASRSRR